MSIRRLRDLGLALALVAIALPAFAKTVPETVPGELLVKFRSDRSAADRASILASIGGSVVRSYPLTGVQHVRVSGDAGAAIAALAASPAVAYAEPNYVVKLAATPNDPSYPSMWGLNNTGQTGGTPDADIDAPEAWDIQTGSSSVLIGVIDTGIDIDHPDLVGNLWTNPGETPGNGIDDDGNGYIDDIHGINAITGSGNPDDDNGHGTHCAGTIGAEGNNGNQVVGVAWDVQILGCKFLNSGGSGNTADALECLEYTTMMGVNLTSNSWGGGGYSQAMADALAVADAQGMLFVAAAGNGAYDNDASPSYPASYANDNVVAVASTDHNDNLSSFSQYGATSVDVAAPGSSILSTWFGGGTNTISGTSMATPHVAGLLALLESELPGSSNAALKSRLMLTVDGLGLPVASGGRINAYTALTADLSGPILTGLSPAFGGPGSSATLSGLNFGASQGGGFVSFGATTAAVSSWSDESIVITVPALADGAYAVSVTTDGGDTTADRSFNIVTPYYDEEVLPNTFIGGGVAQGWNADDACWNLALPVAFEYYGSSYGSVWVCSNGILDFGGSDSAYSNSTAGLIGNERIAALWDDLRTDQAGNDIFVHQPTATSVAIRWQGVTYSGSLPVNFEVVLDSDDGSIQLNYGSGNTNLTPTVGISEGNGARYQLSPHDGASSLTNASSIRYSTDGGGPTCPDADGDGYGNPGSALCSGGPETDCDDSDPAVNPGQAEIPGNGLDDDCDPSTPSGCQQELG